MGTHIPYGITQCYLPPGRGDMPAFTPAEAGTRFRYPRGMQGWVDLGGWLEMVYPYNVHPSWTNHRCEKLAQSFYAMVPGRDSNPRPLDRESDTLPQHHDATCVRHAMMCIPSMLSEARISFMLCNGCLFSFRSCSTQFICSMTCPAVTAQRNYYLNVVTKVSGFTLMSSFGWHCTVCKFLAFGDFWLRGVCCEMVSVTYLLMINTKNNRNHLPKN